MDNFYQQERYEQAKKQVQKLKGFYVHLLVYLVVNAFILIVQYQNLHEGESIFTFGRFSTAFFWGIGLVAHAATVFVPRFIFTKSWEDRKIKEYMNEDQFDRN
ncbi:MAG: 2TM domain-containing protein [Mangrovimonas sp.]|nr:2TM domain-containing protein [Mangrovimonas sp.]